MNKRSKQVTALAAALLLAVAAGVPAAGLAAAEVAVPVCIDNHGLPKTASAYLAEIGLDAAHGRWSTVTEDGRVLGFGDVLATGQAIEARSIEGGVLERRSVAVLGDVTGTGMAGISQVVRMAQALAGVQPLTGIWLQAADINGSGTLDISDIVLACGQLQHLNGEAAETSGRTKVPFRTPAAAAGVGLDEISVAFQDEEMDIPYISARQAGTMLEKLVPFARNDEVTCTEYCGGMISVWQRANGSTVEINYMSGEMLFADMSLWSLPAGAGSIIDVVESVGPDSPFKRTEAFERQGGPVLRNLSDHGIPLAYDADNRTGLLPLATFSDICLSPAQCPLAYNGDACFLTLGGALADLENEYYSVPARQRSAALARFTYDELCFAMDLLYGLQEVHHIESFDAYLKTTGLAEQLLSENPVAAGTALYSLLRGYLGDGHSRYVSNSSYAGREANCRGLVSPSVAGIQAAWTRMRALRSAQYPDGVPAYQEIGDTAYITFDEFVFSGQTYEDGAVPDADDPGLDTAGLISYANRQIKRQNSPITKVVIDLSCNTGGDSDAAVYTAAWFLGEAPVSLLYTSSGAEATTIYQADVNGNGVFGESGDTVKDLERYCMISDVSFSCGNLVPAIFKNSEQVTLVGKQSHGGACAVEPLTAADGTIFCISSPLQLSWLYNGSLYDIDQGVEPDVPITTDAHYYDREYLSGFLGTLLR